MAQNTLGCVDSMCVREREEEREGDEERVGDINVNMYDCGSACMCLLKSGEHVNSR